MRISAKIFNGITETVECLLDERAPVLFVQLVTKDLPFVRIVQFSTGSRKGKTFGHIQPVQFREEFTLELIPEHINRDKEAAAGFPDLMILRQPASGYDTVHVDMVIQFLVPCMQHLDNTRNSTEILWGS